METDKMAVKNYFAIVLFAVIGIAVNSVIWFIIAITDKEGRFLELFCCSFAADGAVLIALFIGYFFTDTYIFYKDKIVRMKGKKVIAEKSIAEIQKFEYIRFRWIFLLQIGSGSLVLSYLTETQDKFMSTFYAKQSTAKVSVSMSKRTMKKIEALINRPIRIV